VLKRIPPEHRPAAFKAAIEEIDAAKRRAKLEQELKDKIAGTQSYSENQMLRRGDLFG
jgi:hypothetical protein